MDTLANARELGGYIGLSGRAIVHGRLLRTGGLFTASPEDLRRLENEYHVSLIVDFRSDEECREHPDPEIAGAGYVHLNVMDEKVFKGNDEKDVVERTQKSFEEQAREFSAFTEKPDIEQFYAILLQTEQGALSFGRFFREMINTEEGAVLWHCTAGKDRTGVAAALLLTVLGVDRETIVRDYTLTNVFCRERIEDTYGKLIGLGYAPERARRISDMWEGAQEVMIRNGLASVEKTDGSVMGYVRNRLGITEKEIEILRERYLEPQR